MELAHIYFQRLSSPRMGYAWWNGATFPLSKPISNMSVYMYVPLKSFQKLSKVTDIDEISGRMLRTMTDNQLICPVDKCTWNTDILYNGGYKIMTAPIMVQNFPVLIVNFIICDVNDVDYVNDNIERWLSACNRLVKSDYSELNSIERVSATGLINGSSLSIMESGSVKECDKGQLRFLR